MQTGVVSINSYTHIQLSGSHETAYRALVRRAADEEEECIREIRRGRVSKNAD